MASAARWAQHLRKAHRERGSLGAGRGPASLNGEQQRFSANYHGPVRVLAPYQLSELGAWGAVRKVAALPPPLVPSACEPG